MNKRYFSILIYTFILSACSALGDKLTISSTPIMTSTELSVTVTTTPKPTRTPNPSKTPTATPVTPTLVPTMEQAEIATLIPSLTVLDVFPFSGELVRIYYIEVENYYFDSATDEFVTEGYWRGTATESLVSVNQMDNVWIFRTLIDYAVIETNYMLEPFETGYTEYEVTNDTVFSRNWGDAYVFLGYEQIAWPLEVGQSWGTPTGNPFGGEVAGIWHVIENIDVTMPAGEFVGCFRIRKHESTSSTDVTFCPKIGIVEADYINPNFAWSEIWELVDIFER